MLCASFYASFPNGLVESWALAADSLNGQFWVVGFARSAVEEGDFGFLFLLDHSGSMWNR